ncbi:MAG: elongation factor P [Bacteroidales bacterium]|nr:elongation factor P [Bacteroidales bacterium]
MADTTDIKNGLCINFNNDIYTIVEFLHVKPGKGAAFVRTKMRSVKTGRVLENTFPSGAKIDVVRVERRPYTYLYKEGDMHVFMHTETFEQIYIDEAIINAPQWLRENQYAEITVHADTETPLICELPAIIETVITYTEPGFAGNTATNAMKDATVEPGVSIRVPLFINEGDKVRVNTSNNEYRERIK